MSRNKLINHSLVNSCHWTNAKKTHRLSLKTFTAHIKWVMILVFQLLAFNTCIIGINKFLHPESDMDNAISSIHIIAATKSNTIGFHHHSLNSMNRLRELGKWYIWCIRLAPLNNSITFSYNIPDLPTFQIDPNFQPAIFGADKSPCRDSQKIFACTFPLCLQKKLNVDLDGQWWLHVTVRCKFTSRSFLTPRKSKLSFGGS